MSRFLITSDLHLGHKNAYKWRTQFDSPEHHDEYIFERLASNVNKRDTLVIVGDAAFTEFWNEQIGLIKCKKKVLIPGNHCTEYVHMSKLVESYDQIHALWSKKNCWFSHCPIHYQEMRGKILNIHGHLHANQVWKEGWELDEHNIAIGEKCELDTRYFNVCLEHTDYKPIDFQEIKKVVGI